MAVTGLSRCPSCDEPLEPGDNFCGACGVAVAAAPPTGPKTGEHPTLTLSGPLPGGTAPRSGDPATGAAAPYGRATSYEHAAPSAGNAAPSEQGDVPYGPSTTYATSGLYDPGAAHGPNSAHGTSVAYGPSVAYGGPPPPAAETRLPDSEASTAPGAPGAPEPPRASEPEDYDLAAPTGSTTGEGSAPDTRGSAPEPGAGAPGDAGQGAAAPGGADPREAFGATADGSADAGSPDRPAPAPAAPLCAVCHGGAVDRDGYCENCGHAQPRPRDHFEQELERLAAVSDRGLRHHRNEDFFAIGGTALSDGSPAVVAVVCDGVSSATRPDEASQAAAETAGESLLGALPRGTHPQEAMHDAILAAAKAVDALAAGSGAEQPDPYRRQNAPACTLVAAVAAGGLLTVGWVGDSRAYWIPDDRTAPAARLTEDDSWAAQMVANNLMSEAEAYADERAHAITGWLGADAYELQPHTATFRPDGPGVAVVCTDGLWNYTEAAAELAAVLPSDAAAQPLRSAQILVRHALDSGGHDNVTVAVVPFPAPAAGAGSA